MPDDSSSTRAPSMSLEMRAFFAFLLLAVGALGFMTWRLSHQNQVLQDTVARLEEKALSSGLAVGERVTPLELTDAEGVARSLTFGSAKPATLLLLTSLGCGACDETIPIWEAILLDADVHVWGAPTETTAGSSVRVVCVQAGSTQPEDLRGISPVFACAAVASGQEGWLRRIPSAPSAVLLSPEGVVLQRWFGHLSNAQSESLAAALLDLASLSAH